MPEKLCGECRERPATHVCLFCGARACALCLRAKKSRPRDVSDDYAWGHMGWHCEDCGNTVWLHVVGSDADR